MGVKDMGTGLKKKGDFLAILQNKPGRKKAF